MFYYLGNSGGLTHHRNWFWRYHPGYFGKKGIRVFHLKKNPRHRPSINIDSLWNLVSSETRLKYQKEKVNKFFDFNKKNKRKF